VVAVSRLVGRLTKRAAAFRVLAVSLLLLGVAGGAFLRTERIDQQRRTNAEAAARVAVERADREAAQQQAALGEAQRTADAAAAAAAAQAKAAEDAARGASTTSRSNSRGYGPIPASCQEFTGNQAIGCALLSEFGFGIDQMACLVPMWMHESHWNANAHNPTTGAHGIAQALPASRMSEFGADYLTNPATQIRWGLSYIKKRYKMPCGAWDFWQAHHWY
jgi:Transglycosylase SLT domain